VRVRFLDHEHQHPPLSYAIPSELPSLAATVSPAEGSLSTDELTVFVAEDGALTAKTASGTVFVAEPPNSYRRRRGGFTWVTALADAESCHGLGERSFGLSLRGRRYGLWNTAKGAYRAGDDPLYLSIPFFLGVRPDLSHGIFFDHPERAAIELDLRGDGLLRFTGGRRPVTMYLIIGTHPAQVVGRFTGLVGRMELPPLWAIGYHHSRWGLRNEAAFRELAEQTRAHRIPCDAVHFDIDHMDGYRVFSWDRERFPDPAALLADLRSSGLHSVAILDPGVKVDPADPTYADASARGLFCRTQAGGRLVRRVWAGRSEFPDFTDPQARSWWADRSAAFAATGVDGLWVDMNEPSTFDLRHTLPDATPHQWEGRGNTHAGGGHGVYGMQMARATRDGLAALRPQRRPFVFSRAGYAGLQRYASSWNGDSRATWSHLRMTIPQLLNLGLSGIAFTGSDVGGFQGNPGAEQYLRWMQLACLTPFFRSHSTRSARNRTAWSFGEPTTGRVREAIERRYRLLPYLYTAFQAAAAEGMPILRPMFFDDPADADLVRVEDQFLLGDHLVVAPILHQGARGRQVRLPSGDWYRWESGTRTSGGRTLWEAAGLGLPTYVRAGAVVPTWPVARHTGIPVETLILDVYRGTATSWLYEDSGDGYGYRDGHARRSRFNTRHHEGSFTMHWSRTGPFVPDYRKVRVRIFGLAKAAVPVTIDGTPHVGQVAEGVLTLDAGIFTTLHVG
ncbi:MAG: TIM-barrel domain-containing protein, partial [Propioniciclava sp.]